MKNEDWVGKAALSICVNGVDHYHLDESTFIFKSVELF